MNVWCMFFGHSWTVPPDVWAPLRCARCGRFSFNGPPPPPPLPPLRDEDCDDGAGPWGNHP